MPLGGGGQEDLKVNKRGLIADGISFLSSLKKESTVLKDGAK
jgi:hypothetical protein